MCVCLCQFLDKNDQPNLYLTMSLLVEGWCSYSKLLVLSWNNKACNTFITKIKKDCIQFIRIQSLLAGREQF